MHFLQVFLVIFLLGALDQCVANREPYSIENVILARRVVNEVNMKDVNATSDPKRNETVREIEKYLKNNPGAQERYLEDKADYETNVEKGENETKTLEFLLSSGLIPYMFDRCNKSYTINHEIMYNISLQYDVGNNSMVPYETTGDRIRVAYMKFQDYINRMNQWTRKLIKGGSFTLKKVERDTFCNLVYKSNYTNSINNTKLVTRFEEELQEQVAYCLNHLDELFRPHYEKVQEALLQNPIFPKYVPLGRELQEKFIIDCNLYNPIREKLWHLLMTEPMNHVYRDTFKNYKENQLDIHLAKLKLAQTKS
uniref:Uncharacterized protein n=1 Tax=Cacopsylla melanoneura TaxID=428564 RepID=A0A8D9EJB9_9HEMI